MSTLAAASATATATRPAAGRPLAAVLQRKCACGAGASPLAEGCAECERKKAIGLQTKLAVGAYDDPLEREADRVAAQVLAAAPADRVTPAAAAGGPARRMPTISPAGTPPAGGAEAPAIVGEVLGGGGQPLDAGTRRFMEPRFGHDFGKVRVHGGPRAAASAAAVGARAYTVGHHVVFGAGEFAPHTLRGRQLLAHELVHTVQQGTGVRLQRNGPEGVAGAAAAGAVAGAAGAAAGAAGALAGAAAAAAAGAAGGAAAAGTQPSVQGWAARTSGATQADNCCAVCPVDLGVDIDSPNFRNGIELRATLRHHAAGYTYDIKRTKEAKYWRRNGASDPWATIASWNKPAGSDDDGHDSDECLTPVAAGSRHRIWAEDRPGFRPDNLSDSYTDYVQMINFVEFVRITAAAGGHTDDPLQQNWHTKMHVTKGAGGTWSVDSADSEIATGHLGSLSP